MLYKENTVCFFKLVIAWVRMLVMVVVVRMSMMCWICCMCWVVMHWVVMVGWIMVSWIKMGWRSNRIIWMSPTMLSSITIMSVIVSHNFSSFRFRYRLCYKSINSLRKCLCQSNCLPFTPQTKDKDHSN